MNETNLPNISGEIPTWVTGHSNDCFVSTFSFTRAFFIDSHHQCHTRNIFVRSCNSTDLHPRTMSHDSGENGFISEPPTSFPSLEFQKIISLPLTIRFMSYIIKFLCVFSSLVIINSIDSFFSFALEQCDQKSFEFFTSILFDVCFQALKWVKSWNIIIFDSTFSSACQILCGSLIISIGSQLYNFIDIFIFFMQFLFVLWFLIADLTLSGMSQIACGDKSFN